MCRLCAMHASSVTVSLYENCIANSYYSRHTEAGTKLALLQQILYVPRCALTADCHRGLSVHCYRSTSVSSENDLCQTATYKM